MTTTKRMLTLVFAVAALTLTISGCGDCPPTAPGCGGGDNPQSDVPWEPGPNATVLAESLPITRDLSEFGIPVDIVLDQQPNPPLGYRIIGTNFNCADPSGACWSGSFVFRFHEGAPDSLLGYGFCRSMDPNAPCEEGRSVNNRESPRRDSYGPWRMDDPRFRYAIFVVSWGQGGVNPPPPITGVRIVIDLGYEYAAA